jgi:hypothetical protein
MEAATMSIDNPRFPDPGDEPFNASYDEIHDAWGDLKAIQTEYRGFLFRSRLEARWAVFFDTLKIDFLYEPEGFELPNVGRYLPDFWIPVIRYWAEVKPCQMTKHEESKALALADYSHRPVLLLEGPPEFIHYDAIFPDLQRPSESLRLNCLLDIDQHARRYYYQERRLYANFPPGEFFPFTEEYGEAVYASRRARFEVRS